MITPKKFKLWHHIGAAVALVVSAVTYLLTIEPSASFWDCGEFIASSYKLEVGHPPGNPVFQLIARFFTMFGDNMHAAILVNAMSALCSALTIFFLYLTIVWLAKRLFKPSEEGYTAAQAVAIIGSGLVGALVYCFSDTFWFSAVEGEVYAMSSLFTALVFWAMTMWYDHADEPHSGRWIVLIAFLMGLSIGVHLLNLLAIPALVFMFYYRRREEKPFTGAELVKVFAVGVVILAVILFAIIPWLPKLAAYFDLLFVNVFGLPYNSGAAFFVLALLALCFWGIFATMKRGKFFWNTALLCLTTIIIGFSVFSLDIIRSAAKTPTNEYQPDNAFTLVRYLSREQYGKNPLVYGQYYGASYDIKTTTYWAPLDGRYEKVAGPIEAAYKSSDKMLFPRMWSNTGDSRTLEFYSQYNNGGRKPSQASNLAYFFDYQLGWMYWRYFMWNFVGRQNDIHSPSPGELFAGNWESGIRFIDEARLGDQSDAPAILADNKGKNHYFFLPLLLGLLGLFFQFGRDRRGCWLTFLMFFMTGIAIVIYLNQPPFQVRERDYAYAGSFYFFSVWAGLGVAGLISLVSKLLKGRAPKLVAIAAACCCLGVPVLMACQNWDDHNRAGRRTAVEVARNYLNSVGPHGILITHGDNDTFPLWYAQEVEGFRTDVRIVNTSLLGTDWHIDQMKWAVNESAPLDLQVDQRQYLYGTNEYIPVYDTRGQEMKISDVMKIFRHPDAKLPLASGTRADYIPSRKIVVPVDRENVIKYGILPAKYYDQIPESIVLTIPEGKDAITKPELFVLDFLSCYKWDRPFNMLSYGGDINIGIKDYLMSDGYSYRFIPLRNTPTATSNGPVVDTDNLYRQMKESFSWDALAADDWFIDYQNYYTHLGSSSVRSYFQLCADAFIRAGEYDRAAEALDKCMEVSHRLPLDCVPLGFSGANFMLLQIIDDYYAIGRADTARILAFDFASELLVGVQFYYGFYEYAKSNFEQEVNYVYYLIDVMKTYGDKAAADELDKLLHSIANAS